MTAVPLPEPLRLPPGYGEASALLSWESVERRLVEAPRYWLATVRADGRPHVVPVDGLWAAGRWFFGGSDDSVRQQNLLTNPQAALHLEDALAVVVVEGRCDKEVPTEDVATELARASEEKYGYAPPVTEYLKGIWTLTPVRALAWTSFPADATRFRFEDR